MAVEKDCVFCKIASGQEGRVLYQDEKVIVFKTRRPAAEHHYLICPREHIRNAKSLRSHNIPLVEHMLTVGKLVLQQEHADLNKARFGFHWPPFCSVNHLHLHAISPDDRLKLRVRLTGVFSLWMPWFKSVDWLIRRLAASDKSVKDSAVPTTTNDLSYNAVKQESNHPLNNAVLPDTNDPLNNAVPAETKGPLNNTVPAETNGPLNNAVPAETKGPLNNTVPAETNGPLNNAVPAETNISLNNAIPAANNISLNNGVLIKTDNLQQDCPVTKDFHAAVTSKPIKAKI